jgi:anti-sigma28 factor (negative regulator of flagellin synthesis)
MDYMQLSDREIQNTLDLLKKSQKMGEDKESTPLTDEDREGIQQVVKQIDTMPEVRKDRVEKIKKALESSSYNVTGDDIAKKLIGRIFSDKLH